MFKIFQNKWFKIFICGPRLPFSSSPVLARVLISLVCHPLKVTMKLLNQHQILIRRNPHTYLPRVLLSDTSSNAKSQRQQWPLQLQPNPSPSLSSYYSFFPFLSVIPLRKKTQHQPHGPTNSIPYFS